MSTVAIIVKTNTSHYLTEALSRVGSFGNKAYLQKAVEMFEDFLGYGWVSSASGVCAFCLVLMLPLLLIVTTLASLARRSVAEGKV
jgi:hypothetical protein